MGHNNLFSCFQYDSADTWRLVIDICAGAMALVQRMHGIIANVRGGILEAERSKER